ALSQIDLHPQMILVTSLNKAFAAAGGAIVLPRAEWARKIRTCGGTLIFSTPIQPPMLGAGVASARLHLTEEITRLQKQLQRRVALFQSRVRDLGLLEISHSPSPIFYIPTSLPKVSYNLVQRMMGEGYHMSPALFPAVSMVRSGIRVCVNVNHREADIEQMLAAMAYHYPRALAEEGLSEERVHKTFRLKSALAPAGEEPRAGGRQLSLEESRSIHRIDGEEWDRLLGLRGTFDHHGLAFLERAFTGNGEKENNWEFFYFVIRDGTGQPVLATFFTLCVCKDDIFKPPEISKRLEAIRASDPYFMTTLSLMLGSQLTEGGHLYLDRTHPRWKDAVLKLLERIHTLKDETGANAVYLRDFDAGDSELQALFVGNGFIEVDLPDYAHVSTHLGWKSREEFMAGLSSKKRQQLRRETFKFEDKYEVVVKQTTDEAELRDLYALYRNVKRGSFIINTFDLPLELFSNINEDPRWEMIILRLAEDEYPPGVEKGPVAVVFAYLAGPVYVPLLVGLDYRYKYTHKNYKQICWQVVKRANEVGAETLYFGITATIEKRRLGAQAFPKVSYVQVADSFNMETLELANVASLEAVLTSGGAR
ncbi:MAG: bifunctional aminotransferase class I/II-fold pyridoxal phosphate-dependent enzyme/GNAT family N-acetyltransferase, partial [Acidobacteriota bacterium]